MVKVFSISCIFGNQRQPFEIYIGQPEKMHHPVHWQKEWLATAKNGIIPEDFLNSLQKLFESAMKNGANFEELCEYALISASRMVNKDNATGITKITSTVKSSDIDKYAEEFSHSKLKNQEDNHSQNNDDKNQEKIENNKNEESKIEEKNDIIENKEKEERTQNEEDKKTTEEQQEIKNEEKEIQLEKKEKEENIQDKKNGEDKTNKEEKIEDKAKNNNINLQEKEIKNEKEEIDNNKNSVYGSDEDIL